MGCGRHPHDIDFGVARCRYPNRFDSDGKVSATFEVDRSNLQDDSYTQEVFASGTKLGSLLIDWIAGAFYLHEDTDYIWSLEIIAPPSVQNFSQSVDSIAGYLQGTYHPAERIGVTSVAATPLRKKTSTSPASSGGWQPGLHVLRSHTLSAGQVHLARGCRLQRSISR